MRCDSPAQFRMEPRCSWQAFVAHGWRLRGYELYRRRCEPVDSWAGARRTRQRLGNRESARRLGVVARESDGFENLTVVRQRQFTAIVRWKLQCAALVIWRAEWGHSQTTPSKRPFLLHTSSKTLRPDSMSLQLQQSRASLWVAPNGRKSNSNVSE